MFKRFMRWLRAEDVSGRRLEVIEQLIEGQRMEALALEEAAKTSGDEELKRLAQDRRAKERRLEQIRLKLEAHGITNSSGYEEAHGEARDGSR